MNAQEIARERARRWEIALMVLPFKEEEKEGYVPIYTHDEDVDARNLPGGQRQLGDYRKLAGDLTHPAVEDSKEEEEGNGSGATAPSNNMETMETILRMMVKNDAERVKGKAISQKGIAELINSVPSVAPDGVVLKGSKLLSWFENFLSTYVDDYFWSGGRQALNQTAKLFEKAPALLAVWEHHILNDAKVKELRDQDKHKEAWIRVAEGIMAANHGDCHAHQRKATRSDMHTLHQLGDKTVREVATAIMEETKAREVLGVFDGVRTLLKHVIEDGEACMQGANYGVTMMGLNVVKYGEHRQLHANIVKTLSKWADTQLMYTLYGSLKPALQTHVEDAEQREHGHRLMPKPGERVTTFEELKTLATQCEARSRNRAKDTAHLLHQLGIPIPVNKVPRIKATANQTAGNQHSDSEEESQHSSDEDGTGTDEHGANTGWYEEGHAENGASPGWYEEGTAENEASTGWYEEGNAENGASTDWYEEGMADDEQSHEPSADSKANLNGTAPFNLDALLETVAAFTAAGSSTEGVEKVKRIYKQSAERNASRRD
jgi:hypothetical protein